MVSGDVGAHRAMCSGTDLADVAFDIMLAEPAMHPLVSSRHYGLKSHLPTQGCQEGNSKPLEPLLWLPCLLVFHASWPPS
jgi:hypothetical protein